MCIYAFALKLVKMDRINAELLATWYGCLSIREQKNFCWYLEHTKSDKIVMILDIIQSETKEWSK